MRSTGVTIRRADQTPSERIAAYYCRVTGSVAVVWTTVLVMAIAVSFEPIRIGLTVTMLNRPRPMRQLLAFLCGGFAMGVGVGLVVLFILRHRLSAARNFTVPKVQIVIGLLALLVAAVLATLAWSSWSRSRRTRWRGCPQVRDIFCRAVHCGSRE